MDISGVLVRSYPENSQSVQQALALMEGVEVHGSNEDGRIVVTVEQENAGKLSDLLVLMHDVPGVLSTSMIYHQFEDLPLTDN
jgi:nitrate reductase NapD|nr:chaperone NapD [Gammaproteobacteria bacterium]